MEKLEIRVSREQLAALIDALAAAAEHKPGDPAAAQWQQLGSWLSHRYTRRWGLPPRAAAALRDLGGRAG